MRNWTESPFEGLALAADGAGSSLQLRVALSPVTTVQICQLVPSDSPRLTGISREYVRTLAESGVTGPPILVHRQTMRVIDGMHRLRAAVLRDERTIEVRYFSGQEADAFIVAVKFNVAHGLPLSLADRRVAAARIVRSHPHWSDRAIASVTQLAHSTVSEIRRRATGQTGQSHRLGRDGRSRPVNIASARRLAGDLLTSNPAASLRAVAKVAGISPGTVRDVRERLSRGDDPVPLRQREAQEQREQKIVDQACIEHRAQHSRAPVRNIASVLRVLKSDPSLRLSETGRQLLHLLDAYRVITERADLLNQAVPLHCSRMVVDVALGCASAWQKFAEEVERHGML